jgi:hypothetical protein
MVYIEECRNMPKKPLPRILTLYPTNNQAQNACPLGDVGASSELGTAEAFTALSLTLLSLLGTLLSLLSTLLSLLSTLLSLLSLLGALLSLLTTLLTVVLAAVLTVVAAVAAAVGNSEPDTVILSTTLSNGHENWLMVAGRSHGADTVATGRKTLGEIGRKSTLAVTSVVDTLEEGKRLGIRGVGRGIAHVLDGDVGVADDFASIERLRRGIVGNVGVGERSGLKVGNLHGELDGLVRSNLVAVLGVREDRRDHVGRRGDISHDCVVLASVFHPWRLISDLPIPLQDPVLTCRPLVMVLPVQKLMKLAGSLEKLA